VLFIIFSLDAQESKYCSYELTSSKKTAVINEPLNITFKAREKINNEVIFFDFLPIKSKDYEIVSITDKRHEFNYHDAQKEFSYLLFGKIAKKTEVKFHFTIRIASDDGIAQAYTGGRDNVKSIPTTDIDMGEISIFIDIKPLEKKVDAENLKNIKKAKTEKELLKILMNYKDDINLYDEIDELEQLIYAKSISKDIDKIKKSIIKKLS
jgi:hypothetical protein